MNLRKLKLISTAVFSLILCQFLYNIMLTSLPFLTNLLIESIIDKKINFMFLLLLIELIIVIISAAIYFIVDILDEKVRYEIEYKLKKAFLNNKKNDPIDKFSKSSFKNNYLYNSERLVTNYFLNKINIFIYIFAIIMSFVFSALISLPIAVMAFALNMIIILITIILKKRNAQIQKDYADNRRDFIKESSKIFGGSSDLQTFNRSKVIDSFLEKINNVYYRKNKIVNKREILYSSTIKITSIIVTLTISLVTIIMSRAGIIGLYVIISLIAANTTMNAFIGDVFSDFGELKSMSKLMDDMNVTYKEEVIHNKKLFPIRTKSLYLNVGNKTLEYPDISIEKGEKYFLRGKNGAGKSILLSVIQGVFKFNKGNIKYNIYNRNDLNTRTISSQIIILKHDPLIFKGSILENLFISEKEWSEISKKYDFITNNFHDYNLDATSLSLGEKQMIAILRSFLSNKELIIIDEGLAAVSKNNREKIEKYLNDLNRTIIYVSHINSKNLHWKEITIY